MIRRLSLWFAVALCIAAASVGTLIVLIVLLAAVSGIAVSAPVAIVALAWALAVPSSSYLCVECIGDAHAIA